MARKGMFMWKDELDAYKTSLKSAWGFNDYNDWPIKFNTIMHLFIDAFTEEFLTDLRKLQEKNYPKADIAASFGNPARIYRIINPIIFGMKRMRLDLRTQREIVLALLEITRYLKDGSIYNEEGTNLILSRGAVQELLAGKSFHSSTPEEASYLHRFCGIMWAYTEAIFFRAHDVTKEIHGAYELEDGNILLIREYLHLAPNEIWESIPLLPCKKLVIYAVYKNSLRIKIDAYNHLFHEGGSYNEDLVSYRVEIDGGEISLQTLKGLTGTMFESITSIHSWTEAASMFEKAEKYAEIYWYRKKPLKDCLQEQWQPDAQVREHIRKGDIDSRRVNNMTKEQIERLIYTII
jgi:hypothetical protein